MEAKYIRIPLLLLMCIVVYDCDAQAQSELNIAAVNSYAEADSEMHAVYTAILAEYRQDTTFVANLETAQNMWMQFRDAEMRARYPCGKEYAYGSVQPMCWYMALQELTGKRTRELRVWLDGIEEGDACRGSVKRKE